MQPGAQSEVLGAGMCVADAIASPADAVPAEAADARPDVEEERVP